MNIVQTTYGMIYLVELSDPQEKLSFQFVPPSLDWNRQGKWVNVPIVGRNNSHHHLTGGEDQLSFQLNFNSLFEIDKATCIKNLAWLQSLTMTDGFEAPARKVKLVWGISQLFRFKVWVVKSVNGNMHDFRINMGMMPSNIYIDVVLELDPDENQKIADVRFN